MKRYELQIGRGWNTASKMAEDPNGDYVRYEDVKAYDDLLAACRNAQVWVELCISGKVEITEQEYIDNAKADRLAIVEAISKAKEA